MLDEDVTWTFAAIPDRPPTIALTKDPEPQARGSLQLTYKIEDDYGVIGAQAIFALKQKAGARRARPRPLYGAPDFPLVLPQARTRNGVGQTTKDLSDHPWAGADVTLTLTARDEAGNEGRATPHRVQAAGAPVHQAAGARADRAAAQPRARRRGKAARARRRSMRSPSRRNASRRSSRIYLGLRSIYWQLTHAKSDDQLRDVVARLWAMAVQIEDGNISDAEAALRAAQEALRQALERGASDEEIKKLTDELRAALDKFLQALAEEMRKNPQQMARPLDPNARMLRPQDLEEHDRPARAARALGRQGRRAAAARGTAADAGKPADGAAGPAGRRRRTTT